MMIFRGISTQSKDFNDALNVLKRLVVCTTFSSPDFSLHVTLQTQLPCSTRYLTVLLRSKTGKGLKERGRLYVVCIVRFICTHIHIYKSYSIFQPSNLDVSFSNSSHALSSDLMRCDAIFPMPAPISFCTQTQSPKRLKCRSLCNMYRGYLHPSRLLSLPTLFFIIFRVSSSCCVVSFVKE